MVRLENVLAACHLNQGVITVIAGFIAHLVIGTVYTTGNLTVYMASYLQHEGRNVNTKDLSLLLPLQVCGMTLTMPLGSYYVKKWSARRVMLLGHLIMISSVFATSFLKSYPWITVVFGLGQGMGAGLSYTVPLIVGWSYYPNNRGQVSGVVMAGFGLGSSIFNLVSTGMINPDNSKATEKFHGELYFNSSISYKFPSTLRWLCFIYFLLTVLAVGLLRDLKNIESEPITSVSKEFSVKQGLRSKTFWYMLGMSFFSIIPGYFVANCFKVFGRTKIDDDRFLALVGSLSSFFNGSCRLAWGGVMDRIGFKKTYGALLIIQTVMMFSFYHVADQAYLYLASVCIILACEGGHFVLFSALASQVFGKKNGGVIYSFITYGFSLGAISSFILQSFLVASFGYKSLIFTLSFLSLTSPLLLLKFSIPGISFNKFSNIELS